MNHQDDQPVSNASLDSLRERVRLQGERVRDLRRAADSMQQEQAPRTGRMGRPAAPAAAPSATGSPAFPE